MKSSKFVIICIFLLITLLDARDSLIVSVHPEAHPFGWHEKSRIKGSAYELIKLIGRDLGIKIEPIILPWARSINYVKAGKIDAVLTAFYTKQRAKHISYSVAYATVETSVFVAKGREFTFNQWEDLIGKTGLTIVGDSQGDKWDRFEKEKLKVLRVVKMEQVFKILTSGRADYVVFPKISTLREIKKMGYKGKIVNLPTPITSQGIYFGISKKSPYHKYLLQINQKIKEYIEDGTYSQLMYRVYDEIEKHQ
ncbi:MAG: transporter substrate-binding domain-containing protein [Campylobacterota bacterium]|nr:transporter substrate-binding domain-containing protein [Campylobacterota bacterium]